MKKDNPVIEGMIKASIMKEALASCQIEGVGENVTLSDLYLEELKEKSKIAGEKERKWNTPIPLKGRVS